MFVHHFQEGLYIQSIINNFSEIDAEMYVNKSCLIILLFQEYHFHLIHPTCKCQLNL